MAVPTIVPGQPVNADWPAAVAAQLNRIEPMFLSSDVSDNSTSFSDCGDLSIPVVAGRVYSGVLLFRWQGSTNNQGVAFAFDGPGGGSFLQYSDYHTGTSGGTIAAQERASAFNTQTGMSESTLNIKMAVVRFYYAAANDGTLKVRYARVGTSNSPGPTVFRGSGGLVMVTP